MKNKKNLLSVLLAAVLLCACVAGMLVVGASAGTGTEHVYIIRGTTQGNTNNLSETPTAEGDALVFNTIGCALTYADKQTFGADDTLTIYLDVETFTVTGKGGNRLLGNSTAGTVFRTGGTRLPITLTTSPALKEAGKIAKISATSGASGYLQFQNDWYFTDVDFTFAAKAQMYVGSTVEFHNSNLSFTHSTDASYITTSGFTVDATCAFIDKATYDANSVNGVHTSTLIFSGNTKVTATKSFSIYTAYTSGNVESTFTRGETTFNKSDWHGKVIVKDNAQVTSVYLGQNSFGNNQKVEINDNAKVATLGIAGGSSFRAGTTGWIDINGGTITNFSGHGAGTQSKKNVTFKIDVDDAEITEFKAMYTGGSAVSLTGENLLYDINFNDGANVGDTYMMHSKYGNLTLGETAKIDFAVAEGATVEGNIYGAKVNTSQDISMKVNGIIDINIAGGSCSKSIYATSDETLTATTLGKIVVNGTININVTDGSTVGKNIYGTNGETVTSENSLIKINLDGAGDFGGAIYAAQVEPGATNDATVASYAGKFQIDIANTKLTAQYPILGVYYQKKGTKDTSSALNVFTETSRAELNIYPGTEHTHSNGIIYLLYGQSGENHSATIDLVVNVYGGKIQALRPMNYVELNGDLDVNVDSTGSKSSAITLNGSVFMGWSSPVNGTVDFDAKGSDEKKVTIGSFYGGTPNAAAGTVGATYDLTNVTLVEEFGGCRDDLFVCDIVNTLTNVKIGTNYIGGGTRMSIGDGGTTGSVTNILTNVEIGDYYYGGAAANTNGSPSMITNTLKNVTIADAFVGGSRNGAETDVIISTMENVIVEANAFAGDLNNSSVATLTIHSGTFKGTVTGATLADNAVITLSDSGNITATDVGANVTLKHAEGWGSYENVYVTAPSHASFNYEGSIIPAEARFGEDQIQIRGWYLPISAVLELGDRVFTKVTVDKALADHYFANANEEAPEFGFTFDKEVLIPLKGLTPDEGNGVYYITLPATGASGFGAELEYFFDNQKVLTTSISQIAAKGAADYAESNPAAAALFKALVSYGNSVNGGEVEFDLGALNSYIEANIKPLGDADRFGITRDEENHTINFTGVNLLMGDTIGIRLKADSTAGAKVYYNSILLEEGIDYRITGTTIDLYINAKNLETILDIVVEDAEGNKCLIMKESVAHLVATMIERDLGGEDNTSAGTVDNKKLQATAMLVLAVSNYPAV